MSATPQLDALIAAEPDLVDRIFDYCLAVVPEIAGRRLEIKKALRAEFATTRAYIRAREAGEANQMAADILRMFNGRNAREVARTLRISRATVYRYLKQPG